MVGHLVRINHFESLRLKRPLARIALFGSITVDGVQSLSIGLPLLSQVPDCWASRGGAPRSTSVEQKF